MEWSLFFRSVAAAEAIQRLDEHPVHIWHCRLRHWTSKAMEMLKLSRFTSISSVFDSKTCDVCIHYKQTHESFSLSNNKANAVFELVHCDLWGPYRTTAVCGSHYFLTIFDDYSHALWIYLLPHKIATSMNLKNFIALAERQFDRQVKTIRSDNGTEFLCFTDFFWQKYIIHETFCVGTPQQNGWVERKHP